MLFPVADIHMDVCTHTYFERSHWVWDDHTVSVFEIGKYKLLLLFSIQMYSPMLVFWRWSGRPQCFFSVWGTQSWLGLLLPKQNVSTATNSNKLTGLGAYLCSFCSWELSYYMSRSCQSPFPVYLFFCFMPPKNECPGPLLSLLWWTLSVTPSSPFLKIMSSFHSTWTFLGPLLSLCPFELQYPELHLAACWAILILIAPVITFAFNCSLLGQSRD